MFTEPELTDHSAPDSASDPFGTQSADGAGDITGAGHDDVHDLGLHPWHDAAPHPGLHDEHSSVLPGHEPAAGGVETGTDVAAAPSELTLDHLGAPNLSYGGHGLDSVGVAGADGSFEVYTAADHDGTIEQAVRIDADGSFTAWSAADDGRWMVHATGHVDATGHAVVDPEVDPEAVHTSPAVGGESAAPHPGDAVDHSGDTTHTYPGVLAGDLAIAADGRYIDAGPPTYDLDGDGHPETAVVQSDGRVIQVSDTNGDGRADEMLQVDSKTHQAAILTDDGTGHWQVAASGHISADGQFVQEHSAGVTGSSEPPDTHAAGTTHPPDIVYTGPTGQQTDLGVPDEDLNGDGVPESVAVRTEDGDVLLVSDTNADGRPDQLIQVDERTGDATWAVPDGHGGWEVAQTGHLEPGGDVIADRPGQAESSDTSDTSDTSEHVEVEVSGRSFDAGPATIDTDGDGVADTVEVTGPGGSTLFYQDTNGDGVADKAWTTDSGGQVTANYALQSGNWVAVATAGHR